MTELEKMKAYHAMQTIKEMPEWSHEMTLVMLCRVDPSGRMERLARILADYGMDVKKIVPCIMAIMQDMLVNIDYDGKPLDCDHGQEVKVKWIRKKSSDD